MIMLIAVLAYLVFALGFTLMMVDDDDYLFVFKFFWFIPIVIAYLWVEEKLIVLHTWAILTKLIIKFRWQGNKEAADQIAEIRKML